jgi:hypothetical protein
LPAIAYQRSAGPTTLGPRISVRHSATPGRERRRPRNHRVDDDRPRPKAHPVKQRLSQARRRRRSHQEYDKCERAVADGSSRGEARVRARQLASAAASQTRSGGSFRDTSRLCHKNAVALASHAGRESAACMLRVSYTRAPRAGLCRSWCRLGVDLGPPLGEIGAIAGQLRTEFGDCMVTSPAQARQVPHRAGIPTRTQAPSNGSLAGFRFPPVPQVVVPERLGNGSTVP